MTDFEKEMRNENLKTAAIIFGISMAIVIGILLLAWFAVSVSEETRCCVLIGCLALTVIGQVLLMCLRR